MQMVLPLIQFKYRELYYQFVHDQFYSGLQRLIWIGGSIILPMDQLVSMRVTMDQFYYFPMSSVKNIIKEVGLN